MSFGHCTRVAGLGVGNDPVYVKIRLASRTSPSPTPPTRRKAHIRGLAEELDAHRKRQQAQHPKLTLTDMYNVLEKLRGGEPLSMAEKVTHEQGLVSVLRQLHDDLDAAVFDAYGWPASLTDEEILARLVALNAERAAEEGRGLVRWLRPEYQAPQEAGAGEPRRAQKAPRTKRDRGGGAAHRRCCSSAHLADMARWAGRAGRRGARCARRAGPAGDGSGSRGGI